MTENIIIASTKYASFNDTNTSQELAVVGIGASAGGLEAFKVFF
ncbi:MAG: hypothetical protein PVI90_17450 [Desulfobacteraceae bacterium]|jgi:chemotaxis response regulator CheB